LSKLEMANDPVNQVLLKSESIVPNTKIFTAAGPGLSNDPRVRCCCLRRAERV